MHNRIQFGIIVTTLLSLCILLSNFLVANGILGLAVLYDFIQQVDSIQPGTDLQKTIERIIMSQMERGWLVSLTVIFGAMASILVVWLIFKVKSSIKAQSFLGLNRFKWQQLAFWGILYILFMIASEFTGQYFDRPDVPEFMKTLICNPGSYILLYFAVAIAAPVFEELLFRGFWFQGYLDSKLGVAGAIFIPNIIWTAIHLQYDLYDLTQIFLIGILLGLARLKSGSLYLPILLHIIQNSIAFFASLYVINCI